MRLGILGNIQKLALREILPELIHWLQHQNIPFILEENLSYLLGLNHSEIPKMLAEQLVQQVDVILAFGGDGTILSTARLVGASGVPILGINLGRLGFLAEITPAELFKSIEDIFAGRHQIVARSLLEAHVGQMEAVEKITCLNDVVVDKAESSRIIRIEVYINEEYFNTYTCDGLIIASPTGSTAYSLSALGPIVESDVPAIIINPICPHSLSVRPVLISDTKQIRVVAFSEISKVKLCGDGQVYQDIPSGVPIYIRKAHYCVRWVKCGGKSFYDVLRTKLAWGE